MSDEHCNATDNLTPEAKQGSTASEEKNGDYEVGYKKPPKSTQFKKGRSGNPKGSKKIPEIEDIRIVMEEVLAEQVKVRENGTMRSMTREEAIMNAELSNALKGEPKAIEALFKRGNKCGLFSKTKYKSLMVITEPQGDDGKVVRMYHAEQEALRKFEDDGNAAPSQ